jgi:hypothetical protein
MHCGARRPIRGGDCQGIEFGFGEFVAIAQKSSNKFLYLRGFLITDKDGNVGYYPDGEVL